MNIQQYDLINDTKYRYIMKTFQFQKDRMRFIQVIVNKVNSLFVGV